MKMELRRGQRVLITENGKFFDRARIERVTETGDGRILHLVSCNLVVDRGMYRIGEDSARNYSWREVAHEDMFCFDDRMPILTLEIIA